MGAWWSSASAKAVLDHAGLHVRETNLPSQLMAWYVARSCQATVCRSSQAGERKVQTPRFRRPATPIVRGTRQMHNSGKLFAFRIIDVPLFCCLHTSVHCVQGEKRCLPMWCTRQRNAPSSAAHRQSVRCAHCEGVCWK